MPVPAQIAILLALGVGLFDAVTMDKMASDQLVDNDREAIVAIARRALAPFQTRDGR